MRCLICLENINKNPFLSKNCNCKVYYHKDCFEYFLKNSNFLCPICRTKKNVIEKSFFKLVFSLPSYYSLILWFISSILITIFIVPFIFIFEIYGKFAVIISYLLTVYLVYSTILFYPMIFTQVMILILKYNNIAILS
jgi:hypothetical protein